MVIPPGTLLRRYLDSEGFDGLQRWRDPDKDDDEYDDKPKRPSSQAPNPPPAASVCQRKFPCGAAEVSA